MLAQIHIRDLATIEELHLHFQAGTSMITGETGAGKSIFIEAIELALGGRGSANLIRPGKERADISLCFEIEKCPGVMTWLKQYDLHQDNQECIIRRVITQDGRSRSYINGLPTTLQLVKELSEQLFHLHGQYEQHVLLRTESQREILDRYAEHVPLTQEIKRIAEEWKATEKEILQRREKSRTRQERSEYLQHQLNELLTMQLRQGEWEHIEAEHRKLTHKEELVLSLQRAMQSLANEEGHSVFALLNDIRKCLESLQNVEPQAQQWVSTLLSAQSQLTDLDAELRHYLDTMEVDPEHLRTLEQRISQLFDLARKHKVTPANLPVFQEQLQTELTTLASNDSDLANLEEQQKQLAATYHQLATQLSQSRLKAAATLAKKITTTIRSLSLPYGEFQIHFEKETVAFSPHGQEKTLFLIKTNPDQTLAPLNKVISGGELSRLSLAVHLALAHQTATPTLIFDEVDTGVAGAVAEKIGKLLRKLGSAYQVFCVTHQAQVAAFGHQHVLVEKYFIEKTTHTRLRQLNAKEQIQEIARLLGGEKITQKTLEHAQEMVDGIAKMPLTA